MATVAVIGALQLFDQAFIAGGVERRSEQRPDDARPVPLQRAFTQFDFGYAAAVGVILFVVIFGATLIQRRLFGAGAGMVSGRSR